MTEQLALFGAGVFDRSDRSVSVNCLGCGVDTAEIGEYYMVRDEVWLRVNPGRAGMLCIGCVEKRLGRPLNPLDFTDAPINFERERRSVVCSKDSGGEI
jgi:hypothetical protein